MKTWRLLVIFVVAVFLYTGDRPGALADPTSDCARLLDEIIKDWEQHARLIRSGSVNIRRGAELAYNKAAFCIQNRPMLIQEMTCQGMEARRHKITRFVNDRFSRESLVPVTARTIFFRPTPSQPD